MLLDALKMRLQDNLSVSLVLGVDVIHIGGQRHLGVDDHLAAFVQVQDDIRPHDAAVLVPHRLPVDAADNRLRIEVDALCKALRCQQLFQDGFTPVSLHFAAVLECGSKLFGALAGGVAMLHKALDAFTHLSIALRLLLITLLHRLLEFGDILLQRIHNLPKA